MQEKVAWFCICSSCLAHGEICCPNGYKSKPCVSKRQARKRTRAMVGCFLTKKEAAEVIKQINASPLPEKNPTLEKIADGDAAVIVFIRFLNEAYSPLLGSFSAN